MDPKSQSLLDELNIEADKGKKTPAAKEPAKKPTVQNASADELLQEIGVPKKKNSSPDSTGGVKDTSDQTTVTDGAPAPAPAPSPSVDQLVKDANDFITQDYLSNRQRVDPDLATAGYGRDEKKSPDQQPLPFPYGQPAGEKLPSSQEMTELRASDVMRSMQLKQNPLPMMDTRFLEDIRNGDSDALGAYLKSRTSQLDQDYQNKKNELEKKYPEKTSTNFMGPGMSNTTSYRQDADKYNAELGELNKHTEEVRKKLMSSVDLLLDKKILNETKKQASPSDRANGTYLNTEKMGTKKLKLLGDPEMEKVERYKLKGLPIDPAVAYSIDKTGLQVAQSALVQEIKERGTYDDNGELVSIPDDLKKAVKELDDQQKNLLTKHADYRKQQVARAISDKIYKDKNFFQTMTGAYTINQDDVNRAAKDLGFNEKLVEGVKPGDIKTANVFGTFVNELAWRAGGGIGSLLTRNIRKHILGQDADWVDQHTDEIKKMHGSILADPTDAQNLFAGNTAIDLNQKSDTFLEDVENPTGGKFNWSPDAIAQTMSSGIGQLMNYATGAGILGKGAKALNILQKGEQARNAGLVGYAFLSQYDDNFKQAKDMGVNDAAANGFAAIRSLASGFTEMIFPDYKVTDALFGPKSAAGKMLLDRLAKKGIAGLTESAVKPVLKKVLKEAAVDTGKETAEEIADQLADVVTTAIFKPEALQKRDVGQELWQTGVTTAIGTFLPVAAGVYNQHSVPSRLTKTLMYHMGTNSGDYIRALQDQVDAGSMKQQDADKRISVIRTMEDIVKNAPKTSSTTGEPLTETDKINYTNNLLKEKILQDQMDKVKGDKVQETNLQNQITVLQNQRKDIIDMADGVEVNGEGKPLMEGDDRVIINEENKDLVLEWKQKVADAENPDEVAALDKEYRQKIKDLESKTTDNETDNSGDEKAGQTGDNVSSEQKGKKEGRQNVLKPEPAPTEDDTEELDLLPTKQREKVKAEKLKPIEEVSMIPIHEDDSDDVAAAKTVINMNPKGFRGIMGERSKTDPLGVMKLIAEQSHGIMEDGTKHKDGPARKSAEELYGKDVVDTAVKLFPEEKLLKTPESAPVQKPSPKPKAEQAGVVYTPSADVNTDVDRFQPRGTDYSKESANKIINNFDDNKLDPVVLYRDKDGKDYVLAGHSRLEAHNQLDEMPDWDDRKRKAIENGYQPGKIKARYFKGIEAEAKEFADRSNDLGTKNKDYESANSLRKMREQGKTKKDITERAKTDFGKNWRYIHNLSYLNPGGKILTTLQQFQDNPDKEAQNKIEKAAQWVGAVRERLGDQITNAHENEMFDFLMDKTRSTKLERENDFIGLVQNITGRFDFNKDEPLNLNRIKTKTAGEVSHDQEEQEIKQSIKDLEGEQDQLSDRLNNPKNPAYVNPNSNDYADVLSNAEKKKKRINDELTQLRKDLLAHQQKKGKILAEGMNQNSLFDMTNLSPAEQTQLDEELKPDGITTQNIADYEESISDSAEDEQTSSDNQQQAGTVSQGVQQSGNDESGSTEQDKAGTERKNLDDKVDEATQQKNEALKKLRETMKRNRGRLNMNIDPEVVTDGVGVMLAYAKLGVYKFAQIVRDIAAELGKEFLGDKENVNALKGIYAYYRSNISKEERKKLDSDDDVDEVIEKHIPFIVKDHKIESIPGERGVNRGFGYYDPFINRWVKTTDTDPNQDANNSKPESITDNVQRLEKIRWYPDGKETKRSDLKKIASTIVKELTRVGHVANTSQEFIVDQLKKLDAGNYTVDQALSAINKHLVDEGELAKKEKFPIQNMPISDYLKQYAQVVGDQSESIDDTEEEDENVTDDEIAVDDTAPPELNKQVADQLTEKYKGRYVVDPVGEGYEGKIESIEYINGARAFGIELEDGERFTVTPEQFKEMIANEIKPESELKTADPVIEKQFQDSIQAIKDTEPGSDAEQDAAGKAAFALLQRKSSRGETNQIERQAEENIERFLRARKYGFDDYIENEPGWFIASHYLPWQNREEISLKNSKNAVNHAEVKLAMGPNGQWTYGTSVMLGTSGHSSGIDTADTSYDSREEAINAGLNRILNFVENKKDLTQADQKLVDKITKWVNAVKSANQLPNVSNTSKNLPANSSRGATGNSVRTGIISNVRTPSLFGTETDGNDIIEPGSEPAGSDGLLPVNATLDGERGNTELSGEERETGINESPAGPAIDRGSLSNNADRALSELSPGGSVTGTSQQFTGRTIEEKIEDQKAAEDIPVVPKDIQNIRATLPFLMDEQHGDVLAAEKRFIDHEDSEALLYGKAILFTNGTGTGKTLTGLGVAKRMIKQGKKNGLIVVPSDAKAQDWVDEANKFMQIPLTQLKDTKDIGGDQVVTTYANFRDNYNLQQRKFDWVIYDESHKINSNSAGTSTSSQQAHQRVTKSPYYARMQAMENMKYQDRLDALHKRQLDIGDEYSQENNLKRAEIRDAIKALNDELYNETIKTFKETKVVFLSATPFAYHENLEYADGYLFRITADFKPSAGTSDDYRNFYINNFGYRVRYNKLTKPEAGVDVDLLERQFTENLKKQGVVVSRKLKVDKDYSRQFVVVEDGVGSDIDEGFKVVNNHDEFPDLSKYAYKMWNYLYINRLMEALKARASVDRIKKHLELGRKVVVFHSYNEGVPPHPFHFNQFDFMAGIPEEDHIAVKNDIQKFEETYPQYANLDLKGLVNPIQTILNAFPDQTLLFNGNIPKKLRKEHKTQFNDDNSGKDIMVVQMDAGKEGLSLHDKTGKHQRAFIQLGLPVKPTDAIQSEGRIYRTGQKTDAVIEYPILNLNFERFAYGGKIKDRVRTAENFALGDEARNLEIAFKEGYLNGERAEPSLEQGQGGKKEDSRLDNTTEFDKAKTYYWKRQKRSAREKSNVSGDYYATPEPLGMKMVEWADPAANEKGAEPSAGHGAIARFFPGNTTNHFIEPNTDLRSELSLHAPGEVKAGTFEDLNIINKYDFIVQNPPFGSMSKTAMDHFEKALGHLRDFGRSVHLVPVGQMDKRLEKWMESDKSAGFHIIARIKLPSVTFERAGTSVNTQVLVVDKVTDETLWPQIPGTTNIDLTHIDNIKELFERIEDLDIPPRLEKGKFAAAPGVSEEEAAQDQAAQTTPSGIPTAAATSKSKPGDMAEVVKVFHTKNQVDTWVVKLKQRVDGTEFNQMRDVAKDLGGYWSSFKGNGAIPGFIFKDEATANKMLSAITGAAIPDGDKLSLADRIRSWKLGNKSGLNSFIIPIPALWNGAVELVAKAVEAGTALVDALRIGKDHIDLNYKEPWKESQYQKEMMSALKSRGLFAYNLSQEQRAQADKILRRVEKGSSLIKEMNKIREVYDKAKQKLTDQQDIQDLEDSYSEMEDYLFSSLAVAEAEKTENVDLDLKKQTWWQKQKENWVEVYERLHTVQKAITDAGLTVDEKNDMVNYADRWKSVAQAKTNEILKGIGLADTDVFVWKGTRKINDSMFDRMAKEGVDYRQFNLYLYARHAAERNAHNSRIRREALQQRIVELDGEIASKEADYQLVPSSTLQGTITRLKNEHELLTEYEAQYSDPNSNQNYVRLIEKKIPKRLHLMDDGGSGMTNQQADEILAEVDAQGLKDKFEQFENDFREKVIDKILDLKKSYGLIDDDNYDYMKGYYKNYVPLRVDDEYFENELTFAQQKTPGAKIFASKGANYITFERRVNPMTQSIIDLQATIYEGENNNFKTKIAGAIRTAPDSKVWELQSAQFAPIKDKYGKVLALKEINKPGNGVPFMEGGVKKYLLINDTALAKELTGANETKAGPILRFTAGVNSFFRQLFTVYNPAFTVTNLFRDLQTAGAVLGSKYGADVAKKFTQNAAQIHQIIRASYNQQGGATNGYWVARAHQYEQLGGQMSWFRPEVAAEQVKDIEGTYEKYQKDNSFETGKQLALKLAEFFNRGNQAVENSTRLAVFDAMIRSGTEAYKAAEVARNATINFNRKGNFTPTVGSLYLFFNAAIQGSFNMLYSVAASKYGRYIAGGIAAIGFIQSLLGGLLSDCSNPQHPEDCYDNIADYEKERNIMIKVPGAHGFLKIPLAYGFNLFHNIGEQIGQGVRGKTTAGHASVYLAKTAFNSFNPLGGSETPVLQQISPTVTDPVVQWFTNRDGLGRPIYKESMYDRRPDSQQGFASDSQWSKDFADWMNRQSGGNEKIKGKVDVAPGTLDWIFETATGGTGQFLKQSAVSVQGAIDPKVHTEARQWPIINRFWSMPKVHSDRSFIYDKLDNSYNSIIPESDKQKFSTELQKAVQLGEIKADKAEQYQKDLSRNQYHLQNQELFKPLETSKERILEDDEISDFVEKLNERVENGELTDKQVRAYKATITKNQNKLKGKEEE
jgi:hypothetical protein